VGRAHVRANRGGGRSARSDLTGLSAVLSGSFRRDPVGLRRTFEDLSKTYQVLSPSSVDFVDFAADFVRLPHEMAIASGEIEASHVAALTRADFVWLFVPEGYVGSSAALEVGIAHASGIPVFCDHLPADEVVASMVSLVDGMDSVPPQLAPSPGRALGALQNYYRRVAERRGWHSETPTESLLLLTEELGELARAVRKDLGLRRDTSYPDSTIAAELADVQLYLVHLANSLEVDLAEAVTSKEQVNAARFSARETGAA